MSPAIKKAALLILYDNGMINREESEEDALVACERRLSIYTTEQLADCEAELAKFNEADLTEVCCGEGLTDVSVNADAILNRIFEEQ